MVNFRSPGDYSNIQAPAAQNSNYIKIVNPFFWLNGLRTKLKHNHTLPVGDQPPVLHGTCTEEIYDYIKLYNIIFYYICVRLSHSPATAYSTGGISIHLLTSSKVSDSYEINFRQRIGNIKVVFVER